MRENCNYSTSSNFSSFLFLISPPSAPTAPPSPSPRSASSSRSYVREGLFAGNLQSDRKTFLTSSFSWRNSFMSSDIWLKAFAMCAYFQGKWVRSGTVSSIRLIYGLTLLSFTSLSAL